MLKQRLKRSQPGEDLGEERLGGGAGRCQGPVVVKGWDVEERKEVGGGSLCLGNGESGSRQGQQRSDQQGGGLW